MHPPKKATLSTMIEPKDGVWSSDRLVHEVYEAIVWSRDFTQLNQFGVSYRAEAEEVLYLGQPIAQRGTDGWRFNIHHFGPKDRVMRSILKYLADMSGRMPLRLLSGQFVCAGKPVLPNTWF